MIISYLVEVLQLYYITTDHMEDLCPVESGTNGTIIGVDDIGSVMVKWDNGRTLNLLPDEDKFHTIKHEQTQSDEQTEENTENEEIAEIEELSEEPEMDMSM
ncbi:DUF4314 domain-containing protein [Ruminococcus sp. AF16-50]|nr:DUF4314 domain-containing protein [Ruminococcus sp. AF16-50]